MLPPSEGFVYVADEDRQPMSEARKGTRVSIEGRSPPYIVVNHCVESIIVARWPGRLWRVRIADAVSDAEQRAAGIGVPVPEARYARAVAVDVLDEEPAWRLFGGHGREVVRVLNQAGQLHDNQIEALARARHPDAAAAYNRAFNSWWARTRDTFSGRHGSPINGGFTVLDQVFRDRAESLGGSSVFETNEEGERYLRSPWSEAAGATMDTAMVVGAPSFVNADDKLILSAAWHSVIGELPGAS